MEPTETDRFEPPAKETPVVDDEDAPIVRKVTTCECLLRFLTLALYASMLFWIATAMFWTTKETVTARIEGVATGSCLALRGLRGAQALDLGRSDPTGETRPRAVGADDRCAALTLEYDRCGRAKRETVLFPPSNDGSDPAEVYGSELVGLLVEHVAWGPGCVWGVEAGFDLGVFSSFALLFMAWNTGWAWFRFVESLRALRKGTVCDAEDPEEADAATPSDGKV